MNGITNRHKMKGSNEIAIIEAPILKYLTLYVQSILDSNVLENWFAIDRKVNPRAFESKKTN